MPNYRRAYRPGGTFFFTVVTAQREPILITDLARPILHRAFAACGRDHPFTQVASVLLPDHLHEIWTLPAGDADFSLRWSSIKSAFSHDYLAAGGDERAVTADHRRQRRRGVWQPRFHEHLIRDEDDLRRHLDYLHYNPVKHGLVNCPHEWPYSSFHRWVKDDAYAADWSCVCEGRRPEPIDWDWVDESLME